VLIAAVCVVCVLSTLVTYHNANIRGLSECVLAGHGAVQLSSGTGTGRR